jgi:DNA-binding PadR family transcriptional regulator
MNRNSLGEFEHLVLLAVLRLGDSAYGVAIIDELESRTGREISQAATYIALKRLRDKELL